MSGLIALIAGIALIIYAIQHDKKSKDDNKWLKDWGFWVITVIILLVGVFDLNDSSTAGIFASVMFLALLGLLYWRITDRSKKGLHGKPRVLHTLITILFVVVWLLVLIPVESSLQPSSTDSEANQSSSTSTSENNDKYVRLDGHKIYYTASKQYPISGSADTAWSAATADVKNVTVYKIESGYTYGSKRGGKKVQGIVAINVKVKALKDITVDMDSATVSIPSIDEQHNIETKDDWDDQDKGITRTGTLYVPIYKLHSVNSIKSLRLKFDCEQQDTNADDYDHTYDMTIDLK